MLKSAVAVLVHSFRNEFIDNPDDNVSVLIDAEDMVVCNHLCLPVSLLLGGKVLNLVNFTKLSKSLNEFISRASLLGLEEGQPEYLGIEAATELGADVCSQAVIDDVLEIN